MSDSCSSPTIFVVDDDASTLRGISRLLVAGGHAVQVASSGREFLDGHRPTHRGCVVVDLRMPGLDGLQLQAALARSGNPLPVIFLTGHGDIPTSVDAMKAGAEDFLTKPVRKEALFAAVERALARDAEIAAQRRRRDDLRRRFDSLTPREHEVLQQIVGGKLNKQIADDVGTTERTIKAHRASIMAKLGVQTPAELGRIAQEAGIV
jgi:FixJ family two-component response regulator